MKEDIKHSIFLFLNVVVVSVMSLILFVSLTFLNSVIFKGGYKAFVMNDKGKVVEQYTYNYDDGEDTKAAEFEDKGYSIQKSNFMSKTGETVDFIFFTAFSLIILFAFIYTKIYTIGNKDFNAVKCGHKPEDKLRGLRIGFMADAPYILFYVVTLVSRFVKPSTSVGFYKIVNVNYFKIVNVAMGNKTLANVSVIGYIVLFLLLFIVPLISHISYTLGYKDISISDKLKYKKGEIK